MASSGNPAPGASWKALGPHSGSILASILASKMALETERKRLKTKNKFKTILEAKMQN